MKKAKFLALKQALLNAPQSRPQRPNNVVVTSLSNFTPHVAPGLEIGVALISRDEIEVHYRPKASHAT